MQTILIAGAGKSSIYLIQYLLKHASHYKWRVIVADGSAAAISEKTGDNIHAEAAVIDITSQAEREPLVKRADIVVSLMPPNLHILLAKDCLQHKKNLITSSYISDEMKEMDVAVKAAGLMFMCEMGLDPGIDHMSASKIIHGIHRVAGTITSFKSYCGGLIAPESDNNPWHYKFSWNPRNVVMAGLDGARYLNKGRHVEVAYDQMFAHNKKVHIDEVGNLAWYPNRDSLRYMDLYEVPSIKSFVRATLRYPEFCIGWQALIMLGLTQQDDFFDVTGHTYASWIAQKTAYEPAISLRRHVAAKLSIAENDKVINMLQWLGLFSDAELPGGRMCSGDILLGLLQEKWQMAPEDKDMVVMQHEIEYLHKDHPTKFTSTMVIKGENREFSAMARCVGLPMAVLAKMAIGKKIALPAGVVLPNMQTIYRPLLTELVHHGIEFKEEVL